MRKTLDRLRTRHRTLVDPKLAETPRPHRQDDREGMLAEFPSVVDLVRCAVEIQRALIDSIAGEICTASAVSNAPPVPIRRRL